MAWGRPRRRRRSRRRPPKLIGSGMPNSSACSFVLTEVAPQYRRAISNNIPSRRRRTRRRARAQPDLHATGHIVVDGPVADLLELSCDGMARRLRWACSPPWEGCCTDAEARRLTSAYCCTALCLIDHNAINAIGARALRRLDDVSAAAGEPRTARGEYSSRANGVARICKETR